MISILDCTLRDGGYYNNWDFNQLLVDSYLEAMDSLCIDYVEIGFRSLINNKFKGKVVTKVSKEKLYQTAEEYHQYYLKRKSFI